MIGRLRVPLVLVSLSVLCGAPSILAQSVEEAREAIGRGEYETAIRSLRTATRRGDPEAARLLVYALSETGEYAEAEETARDFIRRQPESPELWTSLGAVLHTVGRVDDAAAAFRNAIEGAASDSLVAEVRLGRLEFLRGEHEQARARFDRFIDYYNAHDQLNAEQLTAVAAAVRYLGNDRSSLLRDALRAYDEAIATDSTYGEAWLQLGELFLSKYNSTDAGQTFSQWLQRNPNSARGILGDAKRMRFESESGVTERVREAIEINPNLVDGHIFLAELYLELDRIDQATEEVNRALAVNPRSLEGLSMLAAIHWRLDDDAGFRAARNRVFEINPRFADFYGVLADVAAKQRRYREAAAFARQGIELDSAAWRVVAMLGVNQLRLGQLSEGRATLEMAFEGDPFDVWTKNTLDLLDTFSQYRVIETPHFDIVIHEREADLLGIYLTDLAETAYAELAERYQSEPEGRVRIEVYPRHADFSVRTVGLVGLGALGVSFGPVIAMDSPAARSVGQFNWGATLWHELAHSFHLSISGHRVPRWFTEGLAVFEERQGRAGWGADPNPGFIAAYRGDRLFDVSQLDEGFLRPRFPQQLIFSYYQASLVFEYIESQWGFDAIKNMLRGYRRGQSTTGLVRTMMGLEPEELDERFDEYVRTRFADAMASIEPSQPEEPSSNNGAELQRTTPREGDFVGQLRTGQMRYQQGDVRGARSAFERAKELFPEYAGSDSPYWFLAQIHREAGRTNAAIAELRALTAINENHYDAHVSLAQLLESTTDLQETADVLDRTMYISPYDVALHDNLARIASELEDHATAVRERRALVALDPVDRAEALYQLAKALLDAGQTAEARRTILHALEDAPAFAKGQDLLLEIHAARERQP